MSAVLSVRNLSAAYGHAKVLFDVSMDVGEGEVVALMGRNGAGKSTTLKAIAGLLHDVKGEVNFRGESLGGLEPFEIARRGMGYVPEDRRIFTDLTVQENLEVGRQPARAGAPSWNAERVFDLFPSLREMQDRPSGRMSGGEQQMLTVARTLMGNPHLVLLDEPSEGIAPKIVAQMARTIATLKREGLSVMLSEQNLHFARQVSDRAYVIEKGEIRFHGTMAELAGDAELRRTYLSV